MTKSLWDAYLDTVSEHYEAIEQRKRDQFALAKTMEKARQALLQDDPDWANLVTAAIKKTGEIFRGDEQRTPVRQCIENHPNAMRDALREMWFEDDRKPGDRIRAFDNRLSENMLNIPQSRTGSRLMIASYFMMGLDAKQYPTFSRDRFHRTYKDLGYSQAPAKNTGAWYKHALDFLDHMIEEARKRNMAYPATRMDAQSVVWELDKHRQNPSLRTSPINPAETELPKMPHSLNTILYGPPGTGKTWHTVTYAVAIIGNRDVDEVEKENEENRKAVKNQFEKYREAGQVEMVTFHQNTTYEDFIEGIRPVLTNDQASANGQASPEDSSPGDVQYEMRQGVFRRIVERAKQDPDRQYVLVIDEINRGNIARIFGELITLIEDSKRTGEDDEAWVTLPGSQDRFSVPPNLYILGTMNTADRSIALLDTALRRRFKFREMMPKPLHPGVNKNVDKVDLSKLLKAMNERIAVLLDREHQIGHTYFLGVNTMEALAEAFQHGVTPLLQEYFYEDWEKIRAALDKNGFVVDRKPPEELVALGLADADQKIYDLLPADNKRWKDPAEYQAIYDKTATTARDDSGAGAHDDSAAEDE